MTKFYICRAVVRNDGTVSAPVENKDTQAEAEALFYTRCGQARNAINAQESKTETVVLFTNTGFVIDSKGWEAEETAEE